MRSFISTLARILGSFAMLIFFAGPLQADPVVTFTEGGSNPIPISAVNASINPFIIGPDGSLTLTLSHNMSVTFLDFHIVISPPSNVRIRGMGLPFFDNFISTPNGIDFAAGKTGVGIAPGKTFTITFEGFRPGTMVTELNGTTTGEIPEPATLLLLGTGLAGIAIKIRSSRLFDLRRLR